MGHCLATPTTGSYLRKLYKRPGHCIQDSHRLEKYLDLESFLEKSLKVKSALKSIGKLLKSLEKSLNFTLFCRT